MSRSHAASPWDILDIAPTRDRTRIREAYLRQVRHHHPDRFGMDPQRFRLQEEQMRLINLAYQSALALTEPKAPASKSRQEPRHTTCIEHGQPALARCRVCPRGLCARCPGQGVGLCNRHIAQAVFRRCRRRAVREWTPFLIIAVGGGLVSLPIGWGITALLAYLFGLGLFRIRFGGWRGLVYLWIFPIGLIGSGLYSLYENLDHISRAPHDEGLWTEFLNRWPLAFSSKAHRTSWD